VARRFIRHQPIFGADHGHIHHMLLARGLTVRKVALLLYGICGIGAALSLTLNALQNEFAGFIVVLFCVSAWIGIQHLGYTEFAAARQLIVKGTFRRIIDYHTRLSEFEGKLQESASLEDCWNRILAGSKDFGFHGVRLKVNSKVYESVFNPEKRGPFWQMRIPLTEWEYINFSRDVSEDPLTPMMVGGFADMVGRVLPFKILEFNRREEAKALAAIQTANSLSELARQAE
jgi:UDP-GlcNAc:undecaprenyl-phosphate GlcNAc-1-phosphate transferase